MYCFNYLVRELTFYDPVDTVVIQNPEQYKNITVPRESKHFQILHGSNHWICYKYKKNNISLYDLKLQLQEKFLRSLHPCYIEQSNSNIICPSVKQQLNIDDYGVFSIAFQISLIFGYDLLYLVYDRPQMRKHLLNILRTKILENFPSIYKQQEITSSIHAYECCQLLSQQPAKENHEHVHDHQINGE